jgi:hypothetical protein
MQNMSWQYRGYGHRGGWGPHPGFFILPMLLMGLLFVVALKFLWPLLLFGLVFVVVRRAMHHHAFAHGDWSEWKEKRREWMEKHGRPGWHGEGRWGGPHGFGHHGDWHKGRRAPWGWDSDEDEPKRKHDDEDDDKPKRDGNTLYV